MAQSIGKVSQIIGPVVDVEFSGENNPLPSIYDALEIENSDGTKLRSTISYWRGNCKNRFDGFYGWSKPRYRC